MNKKKDIQMLESGIGDLHERITRLETKLEGEITVFLVPLGKGFMYPVRFSSAEIIHKILRHLNLGIKHSPEKLELSVKPTYKE